MIDTAQRVLELVRAQAGADAQAEVSVDRQALGLTRFANSFIHQNVADETTTVRLRLHADGRTVASASTVTTDEGLRALVARTVEAVRVAPPDPGWPGLAPAAPLVGAPGFDGATAAAEPSERAQRVRAFVEAAGGLETAGYCRTAHRSGAFANSAGQAVTTQTSEAAMEGIARQGGSDGVARLGSSRLSDLDGAELGARAATKARAAADPIELPPGRYEVVLEPSAVADLLEHLALSGFNGKAYAERRSFAEPGAAQLDSSVTIVDDPLADGSPGFAYDGDGTPKRRLVLVDAGVTTAVAHDRRTAAQVGGDAVSTGHAIGALARFGAVPTHVALAPGAGAAELVAGVERGLLITDFWYTRVLDPKSLVVTGLTRNGVWLIEDGTVTTPVWNLRFTQSYPQALGPGAVREIGPVATRLPGAYGATSSAPVLHLASWQITGGASG